MPPTAPPTPYDAIRYPGLAYADTHPDHLAAIGTFYGMTPAPPAHCRVLEVGCGDGGNLVPLAYGLPASTFLGIDLASEAIEAARDFARNSGVTNVVFEALDLARLSENAGAFDYIIAHGVYSWIPPQARDALLALIGRHLAPQGVAFVSYNTYPGCHVRAMMWELLKFHTAEIDEPDARVREAQALIHLVAHGNAKPDEYTQPIVAEARRMENRHPALLYHDDLAPINDPVYFHEFADRAARHGLQFLAEATFVSSSYSGIAPEARGVLAALDPITRQQYLDFIKCRRFRESLLCRSEVAVNRDETLDRMRSLAFTAARRVRAAQNDGLTLATTPESPRASADDDVDVKYMRALLDTLRKAAPHALALDVLLEQLRSHPDAARPPEGTSVEPERILLASLQAGIIDPHVSTPRYAYPPGDRPTASAVVRSQLRHGDIVTSLWHQPVKVDDEIARRLLPLLDGTRDRRDLVAATADFIAAADDSSAAVVDGHLRRLAKLCLLIA